MNWRWFLGVFGYPKLHLTKRQQRDLARIVKTTRGGKSAAVSNLIFVAAFMFAFIVTPIGRSLGWFGPEIAISVIMFMVVFLLLQGLFNIFFSKPAYNRAIQILQLKTCGQCGYSLQGHSGQIDQPCPECGTTPASLMCPHCQAWMSRLSKSDNICVECERRLTDA